MGKKRKRSAPEQITDVVLTSVTAKIIGTQGAALGGTAGRIVGVGAPLVATGGLMRLAGDIPTQRKKRRKKKRR